MSSRIFNVSLRAATLLSKFALVFFLAKFLDPDEVGLYGLLVGTINYAIFIIGFEFYTYSTRDLLGRDRDQWLSLIRDQSIFYCLIYIIALPFSLIVFFKNWLPWGYVGWFFLLLVLEHVAQELNRLLVVMSKQLLASTVLFFRSGAWGLLLILFMWFIPGMRRVEWVFAFWLAGVGVACLLGLSCILKLNRTALQNKIDWRWVGQGLKIAGPLFVASLAIRGIFTFDRFCVESIAGLDVLGAYVLFVGISNGVVAFLDSGVIVFLYPKIISAARLDSSNEFLVEMRNLFFNVTIVTFVLVLFAFILGRIVIGWIDKDLYFDSFYLLKWLLLAITFYSLSMIPHIGLYAKGQDRAILLSQLCGLVIFCVTVYFCAPHFGPVSVPWALCAAFFSVLVWKIVAYRSMMCNILRA